MKKEKGITLIALVITIIVLLILAGVAIAMLSGENGILRKAADAKTKTDKESIIEAMKLAGTTALTEGKGSIKNEEAIKVLNKEIKEIDSSVSDIEVKDLPVEDMIVKGLHFTIKENGEVVNLPWWYIGENKEQITNGTQTLTLGDTIKYSPTEGVTENKEYKSLSDKNGYGDQTYTLSVDETAKNKQVLEWIVLGTDEDGNVLIVPTQNIKDTNGEIQYLDLNDVPGAQYGAEEVNNIASIYGHGKGAISARAIQIKDIDKLTGSNKTTYGDGQIWEYGNEITYKANNNGNIEYSLYKNGALQEAKETEYKLFEYYGKALAKGQSIKLTSTYKSYNLSTTNCKNQKLYNAIADPNSDNYYFLGSPLVKIEKGYAVWSVSSVYRIIFK